MGLQVTVNATQICDNGAGATQIKLLDDTPPYHVTDYPYGYGAPNVARGDVTATTFSWAHESGGDLVGSALGSVDGTYHTITTVKQGYDAGFEPTTDIVFSLFTPAIVFENAATTTFLEGCYSLIYNVFGADIGIGVAALVVGNTYYIKPVNPALASSVTVGTDVVPGGTTFIAGSTALSAKVNAEIGKLQDSEESNMMYWCAVRDCIRTLLINSVEEKCRKDCDFVTGLAKLDTELTAIMVSLEEGQVDCACGGIEELRIQCTKFMEKCCC
jgi:hypothetical protein